MGIKVSCPNGHTIRVKESFAGKTGLCPACKARIKVPEITRQGLSEDAILGILGDFDPDQVEKTGRVKPKVEDQVEVYTPPQRTLKSCQSCGREISVQTHICPFCHHYIANPKDF
jgi:uncharacterized protein YlaI